jgi:alkylation response protein AidB-like acyl-CoA dehydrogenase
MDLAFKPEDEAFRGEARAFLAEKLPKDVAHKVHNGIEVTRDEIMDWHAKLYEKGWVAPNWPVEWGGPGWTSAQKYIWDEESTLAGAPRLILFGITMCGPVLMRFGTEEQKQRHLPRILSGEHVFCQGYSEPGAGSDLASLKMRAELDGDHFVLNGQKIWTTSAHMANWIFCLVRTSSEGKRQEGISFILADMSTPGITVKPLITIEGLHEVNEVFFDDVRVPKENLVGEVNQGWTIAKYLLGHERMGGGALGQQNKLLAQLKYISSREPDGEGGRLIDEPEFKRKIATVEIELMALEMQMLRLLAAVSADREMGFEASMIKIRRTEIQQRLTELKMEAVGHYAVPFVISAMRDGWNEEPIGAEYANALAALYFNNRKHTIFAGSNEIQHNIIAKRVLGL